MLFRKLFFFIAAILLCGAASSHAQIGVYGTVVGERVGGFTCTDPQNRCASNDGKERPYGGNFGVYYDLRTLGPARLGVDLRGGVTNSNKSATAYGVSTDLVRHYSVLGGARASFGTPIRALRPYGEVLGGFARYRDVGTSEGAEVKGLVGLDVSVLPYLEIRAIEFGAGEFFGNSSHSTQSIGAGVVFRFNR